MTKTIQTIALLTLLLASCAVSSAADEPEGQNAAPLYEAIWDGFLGYSETSRGIHEESKGLGEPDWTPGPVISSELADQDRMARIFIATQAAY